MNDALCLGICMIDWDECICIGCGRTADEINGVPVPPPPADLAPETPPPLPANVAARVGEGSE
ncbi:MAG: DUF1289 domain-containing protein [Thauera phenolivorans]|uniref:DUF1289 domain-containing protein n=1 Tax=Thauera phenolivorans TaxID=1792543 RepID=A0A7X7LY92_9RHOO|nr:DUF1289 domain-containing protein [Thauera phenolivorans]